MALFSLPSNFLTVISSVANWSLTGASSTEQSICKLKVFTHKLISLRGMFIKQAVVLKQLKKGTFIKHSGMLHK